jgi:hypothetical protein
VLIGIIPGFADASTAFEVAGSRRFDIKLVYIGEAGMKYKVSIARIQPVILLWLNMSARQEILRQNNPRSIIHLHLWHILTRKQGTGQCICPVVTWMKRYSSP